MARPDDLPSSEDLAEHVRRVLNVAQRGRTAQEMAELLGRYQPRRSRSRQRWYDWQAKPEVLSAVALAAAVRLGGEAAIRALMGEIPLPKGWADSFRELVQRVEQLEASQASPSPPSASSDLAQREARLETLLDERLAAVENRLDETWELTEDLRQEAVATGPLGRADPGTLEVVDQLERQVSALKEHLGWGPPLLAQGTLEQRVGRLQADVLNLLSRLGVPQDRWLGKEEPPASKRTG